MISLPWMTSGLSLWYTDIILSLTKKVFLVTHVGLRYPALARQSQVVHFLLRWLRMLSWRAAARWFFRWWRCGGGRHCLSLRWIWLASVIMGSADGSVALISF